MRLQILTAFMTSGCKNTTFYEEVNEMKKLSEKTKLWMKAAGVRAVKTVAQSAIGVIGAAAAMGEVNWPMVFSGAALAGIVSLLTSIAGLPEVKAQTGE